MITFQQFLNEATEQRGGEIKMDTLGGGLQNVVISLPTERNPEGEGEIRLELYSKGPKAYTFQPVGELKAQLGLLISMAGSAEEKKPEALANVEKEVKQMQEDLTRDLLQLFTQLDEDIKAVLRKYNVAWKI